MRTLFFLLVVTLLSQSCRLNSSNTYTNDNIPSQERAALRVLNDKLMKALLRGDSVTLKHMASDLLLERSVDFSTIARFVDSLVDAENYKPLDEYYVTSAGPGVRTIPSGLTGDDDYVINYSGNSKEEYVALLLPEGPRANLLVTSIYAKYDGVWKINVLHVGQYSILGETAPEHYKKAKAAYTRGHIVDAMLEMNFASASAQPAAQYFKYRKADEMEAFFKKIEKKAYAMYTLPVELEGVSTKPAVITITPEIFEEGAFPMVHYLSSIALDDTIALKEEYINMTEALPRVFKGMDKGKKYVLYRAYNEMPDGQKLVRHFTFVHTPGK